MPALEGFAVATPFSRPRRSAPERARADQQQKYPPADPSAVASPVRPRRARRIGQEATRGCTRKQRAGPLNIAIFGTRTSPRRDLARPASCGRSDLRCRDTGWSLRCAGVSRVRRRGRHPADIAPHQFTSRRAVHARRFDATGGHPRRNTRRDRSQTPFTGPGPRRPAAHPSGHRQGDLAPSPSPLHFGGESRVDRFVEDPIHILAQLRGVRVGGSPWLLRRRVQRSHVAC
jgi:hypothetical protein